MLNLLILRLACLTVQIIQNNTTRSYSSLLYMTLRHQTLKRSDGEKQSMLLMDTFIFTKLTFPQSSWLCFVLNWTPIGATLICSSGTCDRLQPE